MTAAEKIIARASGVESVRAGDVVYPVPDMVMLHDNVLPGVKRALDGLGIDRLAEPEKVVMVTDHEVLYGSPRAALYGVMNRQAAKGWRVGRFFDVGRGGHGHVFPMETGLVRPGMFYFDNDRHCTNAGAIGAVGFRMGMEITRVLATGTNWIMVPKTLKLTLRGALRPGVHARDLGVHIGALAMQGKLPFDFDYRILEFAGDLERYSLAARVSLCSTPTELGAYGVFFPPSPAILDFAKTVAQGPLHPEYSDPGASYEAQAELDVSALEPQVALPGGVQQAVNVSLVAGKPIQHAFIGSCGSSMYEDIASAASLLKGRRIADGVRLFVVPGSEKTTQRLAADGLMQILLEAGAVILPAGCGPCNDAVVGPLHSGEVSISTATNNNHGRFGPKDAQLYLGSPETVAASAVAGCITDPRNL
ncbi:MAG: 3-isopropylmalate dehydratase [Candidatus Parcubacteria bacterium]|nr:3-isopropylmalate dehydratase [Burkholderiales bacterium]